MAWITKPANGTPLNTGHALYSNVLAYVPILDNNAYSNALRDVKNDASSSADSGMSWTSTANGYGVSSNSQDATKGLFSSLTSAGSKTALSGVVWLQIGTRTSFVNYPLLGFGRWNETSTYILCRINDSQTDSRVILACAGGNVDTGAFADGFTSGGNTLVWTYGTTNGLKVYVNGNTTPVDTAAANGATVAHTTGMNCFCDNTSQYGLNGGSSYGLGAALFDKELSDTEAASLHTDGPAFLMGSSLRPYLIRRA